MSAPQFIQHLTYAGERWDLLAWQYYGDPTNYSIIIMANPGVPIEPAIRGGDRPGDSDHPATERAQRRSAALENRRHGMN